MSTEPFRGRRAHFANEPRWLRWLLAWDWDGAGETVSFYLFGWHVGAVDVPYRSK